MVSDPEKFTIPWYGKPTFKYLNNGVHTHKGLRNDALMCKLIQLDRTFPHANQSFNSHLLSSKYITSSINNSCLLGCQELPSPYSPPIFSPFNLSADQIPWVILTSPYSFSLPFSKFPKVLCPKLSFTKPKWYSRCLLTMEPRDQLSPLVSVIPWLRVHGPK